MKRYIIFQMTFLLIVSQLPRNEGFREVVATNVAWNEDWGMRVIIVLSEPSGVRNTPGLWGRLPGFKKMLPKCGCIKITRTLIPIWAWNWGILIFILIFFQCLNSISLKICSPNMTKNTMKSYKPCKIQNNYTCQEVVLDKTVTQSVEINKKDIQKVIDAEINAWIAFQGALMRSFSQFHHAKFSPPRVVVRHSAGRGMLLK